VNPRPVVTLLTDFGTRDPFVGIMKGVILGLCPDASLVDLCHEVPALDVLGASFLLHTAVRVFPVGAIHVAVVDPGVGGPRRPILAEIDEQRFVAPDNGLLSHLFATAGRSRVRHLTAQAYWRRPVSSSFHGRDIFASVAGHLAAGVAPASFGPEIGDPVRLEIARPTVDAGGGIHGTVVWVDRFGNCITNIGQAAIVSLAASAGERLRVHAAGRPLGNLVGCFGDVLPGEVGAIVGSAGYVELFCNQGNLARRCALAPGDPVVVETGREP
jgi:S-adenosyl-L-methionine hydrolase (adenosine-forming)